MESPRTPLRRRLCLGPVKLTSFGLGLHAIIHSPANAANLAIFAHIPIHPILRFATLSLLRRIDTPFRFCYRSRPHWVLTQ